MDSIVSLYTTTNGRISRKQWWLGVLGLIVASIVLSVILSLFGISAFGAMTAGIDPTNADPTAMSAALTDVMQKGAWAGLIMFLLLAYPGYCLSLKRRHDRDNTGRDLQIYMALNALVLLIQAVGLGYSTVDMGNGILMPTPSVLLSTVSIIIGIFGIYMLVMLGFLRGTIGSNSYGPDPVLGTTATA